MTAKEQHYGHGGFKSSGSESEPPPTSFSCMLGNKSSGFSVFIGSSPVSYLGSKLAQAQERAIQGRNKTFVSNLPSVTGSAYYQPQSQPPPSANLIMLALVFLEEERFVRSPYPSVALCCTFLHLLKLLIYLLKE